MNTPTPTQRLADVLLGDQGPLEDFVRTKRAAGTSWRLIARQLAEATDGEIDLTIQTLRNWFADSAQAAS